MAAAVIKSVQARKAQEQFQNRGESKSVNFKDDDDRDKHIVVPDESWTQLRKTMLSIIQGHRFEAVCACVILFNMLLVIAETDASVDEGKPSDWIVYTTYGLLAFYCCELFSKLYVLRCSFFKEAWNVLDFTIVSVDLVLLLLGWIVSKMPSVSVLRVFRLVRLARAIRAAKSFKELNALIRSFGFALKAIFWGILMIVMILTIWSILAVQMLHPINVQIVEKNPFIYDGCERCHRAFSSVFESNLTFFQHVVAGDSWGNVSLPVITEAPWTAALFLGVLVTVNLTMLNLILAVIVEAGAKATEEDMHQMAMDAQKKIRKAEARLIEICCTLDSDESGSLNIEEFLKGYSTNKEFADCLESMNVTASDIHMIFNICDEDGSGDVDYVEFVDQLRRIRRQGEQMLLFYVAEIRHKVQQLKLKLVDHVAGDLENCPEEFLQEAADAEILAELGEGTSEAPVLAQRAGDTDRQLSAQPGATGQLRSEQPLILERPEKVESQQAEEMVEADRQVNDSKARGGSVAEVLLAQPTLPVRPTIAKPPSDDEVLLPPVPAASAADPKSPTPSVVWGQIGAAGVLNGQSRGRDVLSGRKVECVLTGGMNEEKLTLCSEACIVQLENILKMNHDIATIMKDVASQSKLHTGLLNTLAAEVPQGRTNNTRSPPCPSLSQRGRTEVSPQPPWSQPFSPPWPQPLSQQMSERCSVPEQPRIRVV